MKNLSFKVLIFTVLTGLLFPVQNALSQNVPATQKQEATNSKTQYSYRYHDQLIVLKPSESLIAVKAIDPGLTAFTATVGWHRDPLSDTDALRTHNLVIFRTPSADTKGTNQNQAIPLAATLAAEEAGIPAQPVFEQGDSLLIPSDEVIVAFDREFTADEAKAFLDGNAGGQGLLDLRLLRPKTYIVKLSAPENGRVFTVSSTLAALPGITYAEPNFIVVRLNEPPRPAISEPMNIKIPLGQPGFPITVADDFMPAFPEAVSDGFVPALPQMDFLTLSVGWTTLLSEGFESGAPGWTTTFATSGSVDAKPVIQSLRKHSGNDAIYMTGAGTQGVAAPGPYPNGVNNFLISPTLNLPSFEEAYVEFWFYAKYENPGSTQFWDYGRVGIADSTGLVQFLSYMAVSYTGDLTADPTTQNGWRRVLVRVPPALRKNNVAVAFRFFSDPSISAEGLYIDDVRVVGTADVDTEPLGNDKYGAREYELKNSGQIAGLGNDANDLNVPEAWAVTSVSDQVVVAVIDSGVELNHPDLNLVTGYDGDTGLLGGAPRTADDNHGQACAGNVGAIRNNGIGTIGTAPGVKIMPVYWGSTIADFAASIDLAVQHGAKVLSNSWGGSNPNSTIEAAVQGALAAGRTVLFAAGNGPVQSPWNYNTEFPCNLTATTDVICVGASSPTDEYKGASSSDGEFRWGSSYVGAGPDVVAPSSWSYTTDRQGALGYNQSEAVSGIDVDYTYDFTGTSSSTPKVAGIVALMLSKNPNLTPNQVKTILRSTARDIDAPGVDDRTGAGRVDALAAVNAVPPPNLLLTVTKTGSGSGTVTSNPIGINCGTDCSESYASGISVTLTATPSAGNTFAGWSGDCNGSTCILSMTAAKNVTATFNTIPQYLLTVTTSGLGKVTSNPAGIDCGTDCTESYVNGTSVTLTAIPSAGYTFTGWSGNCTGSSTCVLSMTAAKSVTATFNITPPLQFPLSVSISGQGTVTSNPTGINCGIDCTEDYTTGTSVTLTATPVAGYSFTGWSGACTGTTFSCVVSMTAAKNVTATFQNNKPGGIATGMAVKKVVCSNGMTGQVYSIPFNNNNWDCTSKLIVRKNDSITMTITGTAN